MLTAICFVLGTTQFIIAGILDQIAADLGVSISAAGQLITAFSLANAIGTPVVMMLTARMDQRDKILLALGVQLVGVGATLFLHGFGFLMLSRAVLGVGCGVFVATAYSVAASLAQKGREVSAMSNIALGFSSALVLGVPIGRVITAATADWRVVFWIIGALSLLSLVAVVRFIPPIKGQEPVRLPQQLALFRRPTIALALAMTLLFFIGYARSIHILRRFWRLLCPMTSSKSV